MLRSLSLEIMMSIPNEKNLIPHSAVGIRTSKNYSIKREINNEYRAYNKKRLSA